MLVFALMGLGAALFLPAMDDPDRAGLLRVIGLVALTPGMLLGVIFYRWEGRRQAERDRSISKGLPGLVGLGLILAASPPQLQAAILGLGSGVLFTSAFVEPPDPGEEPPVHPDQPT
jgi:hypothetical protein